MCHLIQNFEYLFRQKFKIRLCACIYTATLKSKKSMKKGPQIVCTCIYKAILKSKKSMKKDPQILNNNRM